MENKSKKWKVIAIVGIILVILILAGILAIQILQDKKAQTEVGDEQEEASNKQEEVWEIEKKKEEKKVEIFQGDERPIAVMIDNHNGAWPQAGLNKAYMVYEIVVEGGETRLMALFKGAELDNIGPVRSSRHYFLDYALENDAIYTHYGWSPQAKSDISKYSVNNINGITCSSSDFRRVKGKSAPHNVMTSTKSILSIASKKGYRTTSSEKSLLNYVTKEVNFASEETLNENVDDSTKNSTESAKTVDKVLDAASVTIPHSTLQKVQYKYDEETKRYTRYARGKLQKDFYTGESFTTKNIIIEFMDTSTLNDGSGKGRQTLSNIGTFKGYYITNGKAIEITCTKNSRTTKTIYKDKDGNVIEVNDGNTWINICPKNAKVVIE